MMRLRHKPWAQDRINDYPQYVSPAPETHRGHWQERFEKQQPLHIEVGSGKGQFIINLAKQNPEINYIALEIQTSVTVMILDKQIEAQLPNLQIIHGNGGHLNQYFAPGEVDLVYLNFSDPWPKKRHEKRRLTSKHFLDQYREVLKPEGEIHFKTDNRGLFEYSLANLSQCGWILKQVWLDLHEDGLSNNVMTEYEEKFSQKGHPIYRLEAYYPIDTH